MGCLVFVFKFEVFDVLFEFEFLVDVFFCLGLVSLFFVFDFCLLLLLDEFVFFFVFGFFLLLFLFLFCCCNCVGVFWFVLFLRCWNFFVLWWLFVLMRLLLNFFFIIGNKNLFLLFIDRWLIVNFKKFGFLFSIGEKDNEWVGFNMVKKKLRFIF